MPWEVRRGRAEAESRDGSMLVGSTGLPLAALLASSVSLSFYFFGPLWPHVYHEEAKPSLQGCSEQ